MNYERSVRSIILLGGELILNRAEGGGPENQLL